MSTLRRASIDSTQESPYYSSRSGDDSSSSSSVLWNGYSNRSNEQQNAPHPPPHHNNTNTYSPYQILNPSLYCHDEKITGLQQKLPLHNCLKLVKQALQTLISRNQLPRFTTSSTQKQSPEVIRIQHEISHHVDPLAWLHAQKKSTSSFSNLDTLYFSNAEQTLEAAVVGAAYKHETSMSDSNSFWEWLQQNLPSQSLIYGGERFDVVNSTVINNNNEWKDFNTAMYVLPAVELRKTENHNNNTTTTMIAVHLFRREHHDWTQAAQHTLRILQQLSDQTSPAVPPTTLPPILSRESNYYNNDDHTYLDGQELYERGVAAALQEFDNDTLNKVVLARRMDLTFDQHAASFCALDILRKWKYGNHEGGHLFYMCPSSSSTTRREFFGCSPERLFRIEHNVVQSEALAGTRPRGSTQEADIKLSRDLFESPKDREENHITGRFIQSAFDELEQEGVIEMKQSDGTDELSSTNNKRFFVRRLRHLQHICERFEGTLRNDLNGLELSRRLQQRLHPTPAVCGYPQQKALEFIRRSETVAFDRGFYAGPFGCYGRDSADVVVAIRSGLLSVPQASRRRAVTAGSLRPTLSIYAGAGIVPGSTVQGEWTETSYKIGVISSIFPSSPLTFQSVSSPNVAWANAFVEELIRCGVTQFYVCPGSRSTPLVAALAKTLRANVGIVQAQSIHDERAAGFRALGYARASGRPAAVITSSGTAVANLYPSIMEAGMDGVPMLLLTADRPYESRATGANQAVDQVKAFSSTYVRWFRDIPPPSDDVPVSLALSDADHAVTISRTLRGPVHLNIQFRENLAPEGGEIRNDDRVGSITKFNGFRFTDVPGFYRWSVGGGRWSQSFLHNDLTGRDGSALSSRAVEEVASLIMKSKRGMIVVGNVRGSTDGDQSEDESRLVEMISNFAKVAGLPVFAGVQSGSLRFRCPAVVPYAEHLLKHQTVQQNLKPDFVLQIGTPLVSTEIPQLIASAMKTKEQSDDPMLSHVLLHPHHPEERADPHLTVTHRIDSEVYPFLISLVDHLETVCGEDVVLGSDLAPLVLLGQKLQKEMPRIIHESSDAVISSRAESSASTRSLLTEPQVVLAMREVQSESKKPTSLFLSNSMPVRDAEFFFYPDHGKTPNGVTQVGVNRGASGIDGVISSASGFAESSDTPTTLLIGDLAALHDINALHSLSGKRSQQSSLKKQLRLTTVVVDNDGGGIFSFLPVAKHGSDVNFEEFFGTPTSSFALDKASEAFGLKYRQAWSYKSFVAAYRESISSDSPCIVEATVVSREDNVVVHREITSRVLSFLDELLKHDEALPTSLPMKEYRAAEPNAEQQKTLALLHGWMGDKSEWDPVAYQLARSLPSEWNILSVDLPGHGGSALEVSSDIQAVRFAFGLDSDEDNGTQVSKLSINDLAGRVGQTLRQSGVESIQALAGYSLGGRVSLALMRNSLDTQHETNSPPLCGKETQLILLSAYPGEFEPGLEHHSRAEDMAERAQRDELLCDEIISMANRDLLLESRNVENPTVWFSFLRRWYGAALWGSLQERDSGTYRQMVLRRTSTLTTRARDLAIVLRDSSRGNHATDDWKFVDATKTLYLSGSLDAKYSRLGETWKSIAPALLNVDIESVGHALLVEAPGEVSSLVHSFLTNKDGSYRTIKPKKEEEPVVSSEKTPSPAVAPTKVLSTQAPSTKPELQPDKKPGTTIWNQVTIGSLDCEKFSLDYRDDSSSDRPLGIGWGDNAKADVSRAPKTREGLILQIVLSDGSAVGIGEVCPLASVHPESLQEAQNELEAIQRGMQNMETLFLPKLDAASVLGMDGALGDYIDDFLDALEVDSVSQSVRAGLEMALLSIAAQVVRTPLLQALVEYAPGTTSPNPGNFNTLLPLNGLQMRGEIDSASANGNHENEITFPSLKVKVGHQDSKADENAIFQALQQTNSMIRPDANRSWNMEAAVAFAEILKQGSSLSRLEFVEEPLEKQSNDGNLQDQVKALEEFHQATQLPYALDESVADLAALHQYDFDAMRQDLLDVFSSGPRGCKAFVLKPSLLGLELTMQLARLAKSELNMGAVVSSCFDSGVGLAYAAFLGAAADQGAAPQSVSLSHGLGTFSLFRGDTLSPSFSSYVTNRGKLQVSSLSRALFGLGLDELRDSFVPERLLVPPQTTTTTASPQQSFSYQQSTRRELSVVVSLPLPFSDTIACARFTDLPQQTRWTPWLSSVAYLDTGEESEWTLNIRGVRFKWRATSKLLESPYRGIQWESVSGVKNVGVVEFIPTSAADACLMKVRMTIVPPRIIATLFPPGASVFAEDFLQNKLLKWSLEMFRDTVKGDLALERGDVELGDALFGAAEGRANAIEATLSNPLNTNGRRVNGDDVDDDDEFSFE